MLVPTITVLALMTSAVTPATPDLAPVPPHDLVAEIEQAAPDRLTLDAHFRIDTGEPGVLHVDIGDGMVESEFSVGGVTHVLVQQLDGEEPEVWFSPEIEADPELMRNYWGVLADRRLHEPEATARNPLCGAMKWGLRTLAVIAGGVCCYGSSPIGLCLVCLVGASDAYEAANSIDCNKECKPDCPIP